MGGLPAPPYPPGPPGPPGPAGPRRGLADLAWLPGQGVRRDVLIEAHGDRFTAVTPQAPPGGHPAAPQTATTPQTSSASSIPPDAKHLRGLTLPGFANAHSHAFHRALRGITQADRGTLATIATIEP